VNVDWIELHTNFNDVFDANIIIEQLALTDLLRFLNY